MEIGQINTIGVITPDSRPSSPAHARSTSPQRREQYRKQGRCVRYGSLDHWVSSCQLQPYSDKHSGSGKVMITAVNDNDKDDSGSEVSFDLDARLTEIKAIRRRD